MTTPRDPTALLAQLRAQNGRLNAIAVRLKRERNRAWQQLRERLETCPAPPAQQPTPATRTDAAMPGHADRRERPQTSPATTRPDDPPPPHQKENEMTLTMNDVTATLAAMLNTKDEDTLTAQEVAIVRRYRAVTASAQQHAIAALKAAERFQAHCDAGTDTTAEALAVLAEGNAHCEALERLEAVDLSHPIPGVDDDTPTDA